MNENERFRYGLRETLETRRELRRKSTQAEKILWDVLKAKKHTAKFRRQHGISNWIVDFYHGVSRTVIELDGSIHDDPNVKKYDIGRQEYLEDIGCTVLRFKNEEVVHDVEVVAQKILQHIQTKSQLVSPLLPRRGVPA